MPHLDGATDAVLLTNILGFGEDIDKNDVSLNLSVE
jgi:hypothetical protein